MIIDENKVFLLNFNCYIAYGLKYKLCDKKAYLQG